MIIYVDSREPDARFELIRLMLPEYDVQKKFIEIGDVLCGKVCIEIKTDDFLNFRRLDEQVNQMLAKFGAGNCFVVVMRSLNDLMVSYTIRNEHPQKLYGFIGSLCDRGVLPLFASNVKHGISIMKSIFEKCNDDKDRTRIKVRSPKTIEEKQVRALMGFGFGEGLAKKFLSEYKLTDIFEMAQKYGNGEWTTYRLQKEGLSSYKAKFESIFKIM